VLPRSLRLQLRGFVLIHFPTAFTTFCAA
jgi:hypothetical protein